MPTASRIFYGDSAALSVQMCVDEKARLSALPAVRQATGRRREGDEGILNNMSRSLTEAQRSKAPGCTDAVESA